MFYCVLGKFDLGIQIDALFFVGSQVVAISYTGKVGIWNSRMPRHWQVNILISLVQHLVSLVHTTKIINCHVLMYRD